MFFSDELLTGRKGSLGVIWLMATLGPRSRRVSRKALTDVDLSQSCKFIAEPPEPMALRLSGSLLVGVARVYGQKHDIFFSDVQNFNSSLRRSIITEFGSEATRGGKVIGGIDLPGDGRSRLEQITFEELSYETSGPLDLEFGQIDWSDPLAVRKRRATSKLSSLDTANSQSQGVQEEFDLNEDVEVEVGRRLLRSLTPVNRRVSSVRGVSSDRIDPYMDDEHQSFEPVFLDILNEHSDLTSGGRFGQNLTAAGQDSSLELPELPGDYDQSGDLTGDYSMPLLSPTKRKEKDDTPGSATDVEAALEEQPAKRTKRRRSRRLTFDQDLEIIFPSINEYTEAMIEQRQEIVEKKSSQYAAGEADKLLGGAWVQFFDPEMQEFYRSLSTAGVPNLKDMLAAAQQVKPDGTKKDDPQPSHGFDGTGMIDDNHDFNDFDHGPDSPGGFSYEDEVPRQQASGNELPWDAASFTTLNDLPALGQSPTSHRRSVTSDHDRFSRGSQLGGSRDASRIGTPARNLSRSRSASILSVPANDDAEMSLLDLPDLHDNDAFAPAMLASLEKQCRNFMSYLETRMISLQVQEIDFHTLVPESNAEDSRPTTKRVSAAAFYNCLNLATRRIINVQQSSHFGPITIRMASH